MSHVDPTKPRHQLLIGRDPVSRRFTTRFLAAAAVCATSLPGLVGGDAHAQASPAPDVATSFPIDLPTTLKLAGAQNLDVQLARTAVDEAHAGYTSALQRFIPTLVPAASYLRHSGLDQQVNGNLIDVTRHNQFAGVAATAQIPVGEAVFQSLQSRQLVAAANAAQTAQDQDAALTAAQQYFDLVNAGALVEVVNQALAISQSYEQQLTDAVEIGIAFKGDAFRVQTETRRLQLDLTRAREQRRLAATELAQTLHLDPLVDLVPAEQEPVPLALADLNASPEALVHAALHQRPELVRSAALIAAAEHERRGAVYGPLVPTLGAQASVGQFNGGVGDTNLDGGGGIRHDYAVGLSWRIGPGGLLDLGRIRASDVRLTRAQLGDEKLRDAIAREVTDEYTRVQSLFQQLREARLSLNAAEQTLQLTRGRKQLGVGAVLEDIQAQQNLLSARRDLVTIVSRLNQAQYGLLRSLGSPLHAP
jgi:outer membrane protein TolC